MFACFILMQEIHGRSLTEFVRAGPGTLEAGSLTLARKGGRLERFRDQFLTPWWSRYLAVPILAAAPATAAALWFGLHRDVQTDFWLKGREPWVYFWAAIWAGGFTILKSLLNDIAAYTVKKLVKDRDELLRIIAYVRLIVTHKSRRFQEALTRIDAPEGGTVFLEITRPDLQIKQILQAIHGLFQNDPDCGGDRVAVSLMRWDESLRHLVFLDFYPDGEPPRSPASMFNDSSTLAGRAHFNRVIAICEDMLNDKGFRRGSTNEGGSMFSYPIVDGNRTAFVVNVVSRKPKRFLKADREPLEVPMEIFGERILLESRLQALRSRVTTGKGVQS